MPAARSRAARQSEPGELRGHRHGGSLAAAASPYPRPHACPRPATIAHRRRPPRTDPPTRPVRAAIAACRRSLPRAPPPALRAPPAGLDLHPRRARPRRRHRPAAVTWRGSARPAPRLQSWPPRNYNSRHAPRPPATLRFPARPARSNNYSSRRAVRAVLELCFRGIGAPLSPVRGHGARLRPAGVSPEPPLMSC